MIEAGSSVSRGSAIGLHRRLGREHCEDVVGRRHAPADRPEPARVECNAHAVESILKDVAPELGWR